MTETTGVAAPASEQAPIVAPATSEQAPSGMRDLDQIAPTENVGTENSDKPPLVEDANSDPNDGATDKPKKLTQAKRYQRKLSYQAGELAAKNERIAYLESVIQKRAEPEPALVETGDWQKDEAERNRRQLKQTLDESRKDDAKEELGFQKQARERAAQAVFEEHAEALRETIPDYDAAISAFVEKKGKLSEPVREFLLRNPEEGAMLVYQLAKQPHVAAEIYALPPTEAAFQLGMLAAKPATITPRTQTKAPAPLTQLTGGSAPPAKALGDLPMRDYIAARKKQNAEP